MLSTGTLRGHSQPEADREYWWITGLQPTLIDERNPVADCLVEFRESLPGCLHIEKFKHQY